MYLRGLKDKINLYRTSKPHISQLFSDITKKTQYKYIRSEKKKPTMILTFLSVHFLWNAMISQNQRIVAAGRDLWRVKSAVWVDHSTVMKVKT